MSPRVAIRPRSLGAIRGRPLAGMVLDAAEVARFAAERDQDAAQERGLAIGQVVLLLVVLGVVALLVAVQRG